MKAMFKRKGKGGERRRKRGKKEEEKKKKKKRTRRRRKKKGRRRREKNGKKFYDIKNNDNILPLHDLFVKFTASRQIFSDFIKRLSAYHKLL